MCKASLHLPSRSLLSLVLDIYFFSSFFSSFFSFSFSSFPRTHYLKSSLSLTFWPPFDFSHWSIMREPDVTATGDVTLTGWPDPRHHTQATDHPRPRPKTDQANPTITTTRHSIKLRLTRLRDDENSIKLKLPSNIHARKWLLAPCYDWQKEKTEYRNFMSSRKKWKICSN